MIRLRARLLRLLKVTLVVLGSLLLLLVVYYIIALRGCYHETACPSSDSEIIALYEANNRLNKAFARHDWEYVYRQLDEGSMAGLYGVPGDHYKSYEEFRMDLGRDLVNWATWDIKMISYLRWGDTVRTANAITTRVIFAPFISAPDTSFHHWMKIAGQWRLYVFDGRNLPGGE